MLDTWRKEEGSTGQLIQLCAGYFAFYVITGVMVKYFLSTGMSGIQYLVYSTLGGAGIVFPVVVGLRWYRMQSNGSTTWGPFTFPQELVVIIPSGICTAVVIPTTTLMYTLPITVMVAMTMMRASVIIVSRIVDAIQIRQGILKKKVYFEENLAVVSAMGAVGVHVYYGAQKEGGLDFLSDSVAMAIFLSYIGAYAIRIYLMNYFKNTRARGVKLDNKGFFAIEQFAAVGAIVIGTLAIYNAPSWFGTEVTQVVAFHDAIANAHPNWSWATIGGTAFGFSAFFSVFLFLFKGRTATFAGLVNRLTSLIAGTVATLIFHFGFDGKAVKTQDWVALAFIFGAVGLLARAEKRRAAEVAAEIAAESAVESAVESAIDSADKR